MHFAQDIPTTCYAKNLRKVVNLCIVRQIFYRLLLMRLSVSNSLIKLKGGPKG